MLAGRKALERSNRVVTDRRHAEPLFPDRIEMLLQLHELDFTERLPVRRTEKDQHGAFGSHDRLEILSSTVLVRGRKRGHLLAHLRAGLDALRVKWAIGRANKHSSFNSSLLLLISTPKM